MTLTAEASAAVWTTATVAAETHSPSLVKICDPPEQVATSVHPHHYHHHHHPYFSHHHHHHHYRQQKKAEDESDSVLEAKTQQFGVPSRQTTTLPASVNPYPFLVSAATSNITTTITTTIITTNTTTVLSPHLRANTTTQGNSASYSTIITTASFTVSPTITSVVYTDRSVPLVHAFVSPTGPTKRSPNTPPSVAITTAGASDRIVNPASTSEEGVACDELVASGRKARERAGDLATNQTERIIVEAEKDVKEKETESEEERGDESVEQTKGSLRLCRCRGNREVERVKKEEKKDRDEVVFSRVEIEIDGEEEKSENKLEKLDEGKRREIVCDVVEFVLNRDNTPSKVKEKQALITTRIVHENQNPFINKSDYNQYHDHVESNISYKSLLQSELNPREQQLNIPESYELSTCQPNSVAREPKQSTSLSLLRHRDSLTEESTVVDLNSFYVTPQTETECLETIQNEKDEERLGKVKLEKEDGEEEDEVLLATNETNTTVISDHNKQVEDSIRRQFVGLNLRGIPDESPPISPARAERKPLKVAFVGMDETKEADVEQEGQRENSSGFNIRKNMNCNRYHQPRMSLLGKPLHFHGHRRDARYRKLQARIYNFLERPKTWPSALYHVLV